MPLTIPKANTAKLFSTRNIVKQMASNGFIPVIALEGCVEIGRTAQAHKRGGFDEARERITEEFSGALFWLGGVTGLNWLFEKVGQYLNKLPADNVDIASDSVRRPLNNYLGSKTTKDGNVILRSTMAKFKFIKVISSVLIANAFIGFVLPKINQAITRSYHKEKPADQPVQLSENAAKTEFKQRPTFDSFVNKDKKDDNKNVSFGVNLLSIANKFESDRNWKLLSVDAGTASGRAYSARNDDERVEILFRDLSSIYFYMFNMSNMNAWLNKIETKGASSSRLDPVSAKFATEYMESYLTNSKGKPTKVSVEKFARDFLGKNDELPASLQEKFKGKGTRIISLNTFKKELPNLVPASKVKHYEKLADKMSELQPKIRTVSILTEAQARDILNGGHINNPEFLKEFYKNRFGTTFMEKYRFVSQSDLDAVKKDLTDYIKLIIEKARKTEGKKVTQELLRKISKDNLKINAFNWGTGFATSALFLSTLIPKLQYQITKWRTGSNSFPGTNEFTQNDNKIKTAA